MFLGIDTSNYTTSVCAVTENEIYSKRQILAVKHGERGIRQSDGVFRHMKLLPKLFEELTGEIDVSEIKAVGVSTRPRNIEGSYMPVFLAGEGYARVIAQSLKVPLYEFSHQDGHIMAGIRSAARYDLLEGAFVSVHLSGGTTEVLRTEFNGKGFENTIIGGTKDISAGQLIDRIGVRLGMSFPAGKHMEKLSEEADEYIKLHIKTDGAYMNISGIETKVQRMIDADPEINKAAVAKGVLMSTAKALKDILSAALKAEDLEKALIAGGVASNKIIREKLCALKQEVIFASREYSTDNAMGIAELARVYYGNNNGNGITA